MIKAEKKSKDVMPIEEIAQRAVSMSATNIYLIGVKHNKLFKLSHIPRVNMYTWVGINNGACSIASTPEFKTADFKEGVIQSVYFFDDIYLFDTFEEIVTNYGKLINK